jgi:predicted ATPase
LLLVLDNLEHLISPAALLVTDLLLACPHLKILTTSREALRVSGEWLYPVPALEFPAESQLQFGELDLSTKFPALRLFEERARAVQPGFALDRNNFETVSAICQRLDGLPLAIEMVSARVRLMSTQDLLERMSDSFTLALPADGMRVLPERQKTLHNAISWSYNLLTEDEKRLFAYLSVFAGDFTLATAEQAIPPNLFQKPVTDLVASLLDKSLLQRTIDARGEPRFTMLVTIQQFALERLRVNGEEAATRDLHLSYFLDFAERADRKIHGPDQVEWIDRLEMEHENFRAALEWSVSRQETRNSLRLLTALDWSWWLRGRSKEVRDWYDKISVLPGINQSPALVARLLNQLGRQSWLFGDYFDARSVLEQSRAVWLALGVDGEQGLAEALNYFGAVAQSIGDDRTALSFFEQSFELCQKNGYQWEKALVMFNLAWIAAEQDQDAMAFSWCRQSLDLFHRLGDGWGIARSSQVLGRLFLKQGNNAEARYYFEQELQLSEALQFSAGTVSALTSLGILYRHQGDYDQAEQFFQKSLLISLEHDLKWDISHTMNEMGLLALQRDNYRLAGHWLIESYELAYSIGDEEINAYELLTGLACVAAGMQQPERAARLDGAAHAILDRIDEQYWPADLAEFNRHLCIARRQIGEEEFEALAAEGRLMAIEQGVAYALEDYPHRRGRPPRTVQLPGF